MALEFKAHKCSRCAVQGLVSLCESKSAGCNSKARTLDLRHLRQIIARRDKGLLDPIARSLVRVLDQISCGLGFRVWGLGLRVEGLGLGF